MQSLQRLLLNLNVTREACYWITSPLNKILYSDNKKYQFSVIERNTDSRRFHEAIQPVRNKIKNRYYLSLTNYGKKGNAKNKSD